MTRLRASSFAGAEAAQAYVQRVVDRNRDRIALWLAGGGSGRLVVGSVVPGEVTGRLLPYGMVLAGRGPIDVSAVRVVLRRDPRAANGFTVHTAYPTED